MTCKYYGCNYEKRYDEKKREIVWEVVREYCECKDEEIEIDKDCQGCCDFQPE